MSCRISRYRCFWSTGRGIRASCHEAHAKPLGCSEVFGSSLKGLSSGIWKSAFVEHAPPDGSEFHEFCNNRGAVGTMVDRSTTVVSAWSDTRYIRERGQGKLLRDGFAYLLPGEKKVMKRASRQDIVLFSSSELHLSKTKAP